MKNESKLLIQEAPLVVLPSLAKKVGLNEAIVLQQIQYWVNTSSNERDGYKWVYNTYDEWTEQFPFWSKRTVARIIKKLEDEGYIITGNYNKMKIDRTKWYRINYDKLNGINKDNPKAQSANVTKSVVPCGQIGNMPCGQVGIMTCGQNVITNNQRLPETTIPEKRNIKESQTSLTERFDNLWKKYPKKQGKQAAFRAYKRAVKKGVEDKDIELGIANYKKYIKIKQIDNQYIKQGSTWFNQGCWEDEYNYGKQPKQQEEKEWLF